MMTLVEELLILCIHESKGSLIGSTMEPLKVGLSGAVLSELALMGKIQTSDNHRLQVIDADQTNDGILDESLGFLKGSEKERKFGYWINALSKKTEKPFKRITESLIQKGFVTQDDDRLVWVVPSPFEPESKASTKYCLIRKLRGIVLAQENNQPRDIVLLSLIKACGLIDLVFLSDERKLASRMVNELIFSEAINDPKVQTVQEIESAVAALSEED